MDKTKVISLSELKSSDLGLILEGQKINQKERFCEFEQGPESSENVFHIIDLAYVPSPEKEIVKEYCLKGAGSSEGIKFLNDNDK